MIDIKKEAEILAETMETLFNLKVATIRVDAAFFMLDRAGKYLQAQFTERFNDELRENALDMEIVAV